MSPPHDGLTQSVLGPPLPRFYTVADGTSLESTPPLIRVKGRLGHAVYNHTVICTDEKVPPLLPTYELQFSNDKFQRPRKARLIDFIYPPRSMLSLFHLKLGTVLVSRPPLKRFIFGH